MPMWSRLRNWSRDIVLRPARVEEPDSVEALQALVRDARSEGRTVKAVGTRHSFNPILDTEGVLVLPHAMPVSVRVVRPDPDLPGRHRVRLTGHQEMLPAMQALDALGLALDNSGSNAHPSVFGALATATHGSGTAWGSISHPDVVRRVELVDGTGELRCLDAENPDDREALRGLRAHLGALGILTAVEVAARPAYHLRLDTRRGSLAQAMDPVECAGEGRRYEFFYFPGHEDRAVRISRDETSAPVTMGASVRSFFSEVLTGNVLLGGLLTVAVTDPPRGVPLLREAILGTQPDDAVDRVERWPSGLTGERLFKAISLEHAVPLEVLPAALEAVDEVTRAFEADGRYWLDLPVNVRFTRSDGDTLMSPTHGDPDAVWAWIDVSVYAGGSGYRPYLRAIEQALRPLGARAHPGKAFTLHPRETWDPDAWQRFWDIRDQLDPDRVFSNAHLDWLEHGK